MSALGFLLLGFGLLTVWAGFSRANVFDILRSILGANPVQRDRYGAPQAAKGA